MVHNFLKTLTEDHNVNSFGQGLPRVVICIRDLKRTTTVPATNMSPNNRFHKQKYGSAHAL